MSMSKDKVVKQHNKGVHAPTDSMASSFSNSKSSKDATNESLNKMKNDVKAVIDLMGPNTPHFEQTLSVTDDSLFPNTTTVSRKDAKDDDPNYQTDNDFSTLPPDVTITDLSLLVDNPTTHTNDPYHICPPPVYPANYVFNSECMCPQVADYFQQRHQEDFNRPKTEKPKTVFNSLCRIFKEKKDTWPKKGDYYTINIKQSTKDLGHPKRLVFDLVNDAPKTALNPVEHDSGICNCIHKDSDFHTYIQNESRNLNPEIISSKTTNMLPDNFVNSQLCKNEKKFNKKTNCADRNGATRVDVYYFDHGCSNYFRTETLAEKTEAYTTKFWAELFGTFNIGFSFVTSFVLQFLRFILYTIIRPLTVGILQLISDYLFKPLLCAIFNAVIQPILIFLYNIASSIRDFCDPIAEAIGYFIRELSTPIKSFRLVEIRKDVSQNSLKGWRRMNRKYRI